MRKFGLLLTTVILLVTAVALTQRVENSTPEKAKIKSIVQLEQERLAKEPVSGRDDTGRLTQEALQTESDIVSISSTLFVMEDVKTKNINLPISGERARIGVFSSKDNQLDIELSDPSGGKVPVEPHSRNNAIPAYEMSQVVMGRGGEGVLLVTDRKQKMTPGNYTVNVRQATTSVDIIVNDVGGPELKVWLADNGRDTSNGITLFAQLKDGEKSISGAQLQAKAKGSKAILSLSETSDGVYTTTINSNDFQGIQTFVVEAKGTTTQGLQLLRHGAIDIIAGKANAKLLSVGQETLTDSDLVVEVNVKVSQAGRYYLRGNLLGTNNEPIAWAQDAQELTPGNHTLKLRFAKDIINNSGFSSGFKLSGVELMNTTNMPGIKAAAKINDFFLKSSL